MKASWTQPVCDPCYVVENAEWAEGDDGVTYPISVRTPVTVKPPMLEKCCLCGSHTISGIYVRKDPMSVPYPTLTDED